MKIGILHHDFLCPGGGERLAISLAHALRLAGYDVLLGTVSKTDWVKLHSIFGYDNPFSEEVYLFSRPLAYFSIYKHLLTSPVVRKLRKKGCDIIINTHGDPIGEPCEVTYMHYPVRALLNQKYRGFYGMYFAGYKYLQGRKGFESRYLSRTRILTNSRFTQSEIMRVLGRQAEVVYPPAIPKGFVSSESRKEDVVLTVSRIALDKDLDILEDFANASAGKAIVLAGTTDKTSPHVISKLHKVLVKPDLPYDALQDLYSRSKVYLHTKRYEHFGISVVEAMAHGCVPVVHRSGGPWMDILDEKQGVYGFSYETVDEGIKYIEMLMQDDKLREDISQRAKERALTMFSEESFQNKMVEILRSEAPLETIVKEAD